jgi:hypothetical protein
VNAFRSNQGGPAVASVFASLTSKTLCAFA